MIIIKIETEQYKIPTDLNDLSIEEFIRCLQLFKDGNILELFSRFIPRETLLNCPVHTVNYLTECITTLFDSVFIDEEVNMDCYVSEKVKQFYSHYPDIESLTYAQLLDWKHWMSQCELLESLVYTVSIMANDTEYDYEERINNLRYDMPASICIFLQKKYSDQHKQLQEKYGTLFDEEEPEDIHVRAGIEKLNRYGPYNTVYYLAKGNLLSIDKVVQKKVGTVYFFLTYDKDYGDYQKELSKIRSDELQRSTGRS